MRTTLNLDDLLYERLKRRASQDGRTVTSLLEEAIRRLLAQEERPGRQPDAVTFPTVAGRGLQPGVDLDDGAALADLLDEDVRGGR